MYPLIKKIMNINIQCILDNIFFKILDNDTLDWLELVLVKPPNTRFRSWEMNILIEGKSKIIQSLISSQFNVEWQKNN